MDTFPPKNRQETGRSRKKTRKKRENPDPRPYVWHRIIRICTTFAATAALPHSRIMCFYRDSVIRVLPSFGFTILILPYRPADKKNLYVFMLCRYADKKKRREKLREREEKTKRQLYIRLWDFGSLRIMISALNWLWDNGDSLRISVSC